MDIRYLSRPLRVGQLTLKNRTLMTAMHTLYADHGNAQQQQKGQHGCRLVGIVQAKGPAGDPLLEEGVCGKERHSAFQAAQRASGSNIRNSSGTHR